MQRILAAYDGSMSAQTAFEFALDLAIKYRAQLHLLGVARPPDFAEDVETEAWIERSERHLHNVMQPAATRAAASGIDCTVKVVVGHPAEQIVRYAEASDIDHVVVGHRGHTFFERWLIGSVARQVIAYAPCAVTVVRPSARR